MRSITEAPINEQTRGWLSSISIFFFVWLIDYVVSIQTNKKNCSTGHKRWSIEIEMLSNEDF